MSEEKKERDKVKSAKYWLIKDAIKYARLKVFKTVEDSDGTYTMPCPSQLPDLERIMADRVLASAVQLLQAMADNHPDAHKVD